MKERWNTGEIGCGQLVFELRNRVSRMKPGEWIEVVTQDLGAPKDLPAWCRMTGHKMISADHPRYVIERRSTLLPSTPRTNHFGKSHHQEESEEI